MAYDCRGLEWERRMKGFADMGASYVQGGVWRGREGVTRFAWFSLPEVRDERQGAGVYVETIWWSEDWAEPEPEAWFPERRT